MSSSRWDPWGDIVSLRDAMSNLLEESVVRPRGSSGAALGLAIDLFEADDAFILTASVPGVKPEEVTISILGESLTIAGQRDDKDLGTTGRWLVRERHFGSFERSVELPSAVKIDDAAAEFADGVLTITLPKQSDAKPRTIPVRSVAAGDRTPFESLGAGDQSSVS